MGKEYHMTPVEVLKKRHQENHEKMKVEVADVLFKNPHITFNRLVIESTMNLRMANANFSTKELYEHCHKVKKI